jgi:hypothetical protein
MLKQVLKHNTTITVMFFGFIIMVSIILDRIIH